MMQGHERWTCRDCHIDVPAMWWHVCGRPEDGHPITEPPSFNGGVFMMYAGPIPNYRPRNP